MITKTQGHPVRGVGPPLPPSPALPILALDGACKPCPMVHKCLVPRNLGL